jgi:serine/threonine protein kinase
MKEDYQQSGFTKSYENDLNNEINLLKLFSSYENSLKYYGNYDNKDEKIIILEKCDEDLEKYMKNRNKSLNVEEIRKIFNGLNIVFKEMHKQNIIHRDLKLKNLLVKYKDNNKSNFIVKLGDYGIGKFLDKSSSITGLKGTAETIAPEILLEKVSKYDKENLVDIFSLGVILYQLSHNLNHPFHKNDAFRLTNYCSKYDADNFEIQFDNSIKNEDFKDLVKRMLKLNPKNRLNWDQYFNHPFFN